MFCVNCGSHYFCRCDHYISATGGNVGAQLRARSAHDRWRGGCDNPPVHSSSNPGPGARCGRPDCDSCGAYRR